MTSNQVESREYAHQPAFDRGYLAVGPIHKLHYEQYGKEDGKPVIFLHGGPGGSTSSSNAKYFNPDLYRVVLFDQRGAGRSLPSCELRENTTHHLLNDIESLRSHLKIAKWHLVFGGSWGSTLALLYAQQYPERVGSLVLRGIFTVRKSECEWARGKDGAARMYPEAYQRFVDFLPESERQNPAESYSKYILCTSSDPDKQEARLAAAREWNRWELTIGALTHAPSVFEKLKDEQWVLGHATLEALYEANGAWLEEGQILKKENIDAMRHIPGILPTLYYYCCSRSYLGRELMMGGGLAIATIVQGRYDLVCPPQNAWDLHTAWPESRLIWIADAGHSATEPGTQNALIEVCDEYAGLDVSE
ncbi:hypothetical protein UA08_04410 [Talaromyces atroroseus]|uniref:Proline iminopeptidase n=1 Tax=Talaromyces atroroseus TaxID=1441469 RepID=A0A1Q5Q9D1_TALAT|nr:hypothetical protein UA08_04410 [Talaromyces atroroseus]OKL60560.1 hypothetical protein UA08_04410 [Talaromyces atroroseus]